MIFYRSLSNPAGRSRSVRSVRTIAIATLLAYPLGGLVRLFGPDRLPTQLAGLLLMLGSLLGLALLAGTRVSRLTGEVPQRLDEYERSLRAQAMETAYGLLTVLLMLAVIYLALAADQGWWTPTGYEQWNGVFWWFFLTASVLPTAVLSFGLSSSEDQPA